MQDVVSYAQEVSDSINGYVKMKVSYGSCQIVKTSEDGKVDGISFRIQGNGIDKTVKTENGYRRIVAAPRPVAIVEIDAIKALLEADQLVIAAGGGGIPVMEQGSSLKGASAIIEKDRAAGLLAKETDADVLMFLTGVDNVSLNYGTDHEVHLDKVTAADADRYAKEGQFSAGSMLPKIEASIDFINAGKGRHAIITSMDMAKDALAGRGGTTIA